MYKAVVSLMLALIVAASAGEASAQCPTSVFTAGLKAPTEIIFTPAGNLLVAEAGNGPNTGRLSLIDPSGNRRTIIDNLPSGIADGPSGPSGLFLRGRTLFITIGAGDNVRPGPVPGTEMANPAPSSPLLASVLSVQLSPEVEATTEGFALTLADHFDLKAGERLRLVNTMGERLSIEMAVDIRDFTYEFRPEFPNNVRAANPFGVVAAGNTLYIVDASQNVIYEAKSRTRGEQPRVAITFQRRRNPLPFGPPFIDTVPDSIRLLGKHLLVTTLTGFPFPQGGADVIRINRTNNSQTVLFSGLTAAIDVLPVEDSSGRTHFFTLEFSANMLAQPAAPGRLRHFAGAGSTPVTLADCLISPSGLAYDPSTQTLFVAEIFTGRIMKITLQ
ncbi:MAG TPA: ScyD/ScyE family protein [Blastocatellia bacterium]|jgi:hypothetical protein